MDYTATQAQARRPRGRLHTLLSNQGMIDVIRHINPTGTHHTHVGNSSAGKHFSRLDYIYANFDTNQKITHAQTVYDSMVPSDHMPIWISLNYAVKEEEPKHDNVKINHNVCDKAWSKWAKAVELKIKNKKQNIDTLLAGSIDDIDEAIRIFNHILTSEATNHLERKENIAPITLAIRDDHKIHILKAKERKERAIYNTDPTKDKTAHNEAMKSLDKRKKKIIHKKLKESWDATKKKIEKDPAHIYKILKNTGKRANKQNDKPAVVLDYQRKLTADPDIVKEEFRRQWSGVFTSKGPKPLDAHVVA